MTIRTVAEGCAFLVDDAYTPPRVVGIKQRDGAEHYFDLATSQPTAPGVASFLESEVLIAAKVALTSNTAADIASITLTPGRWAVNGTWALDPGGGTTISALAVWLHTVSATVPTRPNKGAYVQHGNALVQVGPTGTRYIDVAAGATQVVYLGIFATFAVNTLNAYGYICAQRVF